MKKNSYSDWFNIYYSQNQEDLILKSFLSHVENGFYIDIGAHDPSVFSVTKKFYKEGWSGINIEPQKKFYDKLLKSRSRDINLNIALSREKSVLTLRQYSAATGLSTLSESMKEGYLNDETYKGITKKFKEEPVQTRTLKSIIEEFAPDKTIHFLKIDVEGFEKEVIAGNDWSIYRPLLLCIESNHIVDEWRDILEDNQYKEIFFDGLNRYYSPVEKYDELLEKFEYTQVVLSKIPISAIPFEMFDRMIKRQDREMHKLYEVIEKQDQYIKQIVGSRPGVKEELAKLKNKILGAGNESRRNTNSGKDQ